MEHSDPAIHSGSDTRASPPTNLIVSRHNVDESSAVCRVAGVDSDLALLALVLAGAGRLQPPLLHGLEAGPLLCGQGGPPLTTTTKSTVAS